jgi:hypothetical protein
VIQRTARFCVRRDVEAEIAGVALQRFEEPRPGARIVVTLEGFGVVELAVEERLPDVLRSSPRSADRE